MDRVIMYRGRRKDVDSWVYGYYFETPLTSEIAESEPDNGWFFETGKNRRCISQNGVVYEIHEKTLGEYIEIIDAFEGDRLCGSETNEYGSILSSWVGEVRFNEGKGRIMIYEFEEGKWYEVDDFDFDKVLRGEKWL